MKKSRLTFLAMLLIGGAAVTFAQDITGGSSVFVLKRSATGTKSNESSSNFKSDKKKSSNKKQKTTQKISSTPIAEAVAEAEPPVLSGGILNGLTTYFETPEYTSQIKIGSSDEIKVNVTVNGDGSVIEAKAVSGRSELRAAAEKAALRANFYGSSFMGTPIKTSGVLIYVLGAGNDYKKYDNSPGKTPLAVSGGVLNGKEISSLISGGAAKGEVKVQVTVDEEGRVASAGVVSGNPALHTAAVDSAKSWLFPPTVVLGNKVKVNGLIILNF